MSLPMAVFPSFSFHILYFSSDFPLGSIWNRKLGFVDVEIVTLKYSSGLFDEASLAFIS